MSKVMLVEDDNNLREIYEARLQAEGYEIVTAHDGEEALVVAKAEKPDLIISDVMMPKISGFEMLDILRNTEGLQEVKVIMLTALGQSDDQQRADRLGADAYLVKSQVTLEDIVKVAERLLGGEEEAEPAVAPAAVVAAPVEPVAAPVVTPAALMPEPIAAPAPMPAPALVTPEPVYVPAPAAAVPAPIVLPDPVAVPAPVFVPEPIVVPEPALVVPAPAAVSNGAMNASEEAASVQAQIDQFANEITPPSVEAVPEEIVANTQPTVPQLPDEQFMTTAPADLTTAAPAVAPSPQSAGNDDVLANALESLTGIAPSPAPGDELVGTTDATAPGPNATARGGGRIINPINGLTKTDINTLLTLEEAKGLAPDVPAFTPGTTVPSPNQTQNSALPPPNPVVAQTVDPNSIAL